MDSGFVDDLRQLLAPIEDVAEVRWATSSGGVSSVSVKPHKQAALPCSVAWSDHETVIGLGEHRRLELGPEKSDQRLALDIIASIINGSVSADRDPAGGRICVALESGELLCDPPVPKRRANHLTLAALAPYR